MLFTNVIENQWPPIDTNTLYPLPAQKTYLLFFDDNICTSIIVDDLERIKKNFCGCSRAVTSGEPGGFMLLWLYVGFTVRMSRNHYTTLAP